MYDPCPPPLRPTNRLMLPLAPCHFYTMLASPSQPVEACYLLDESLGTLLGRILGILPMRRAKPTVPSCLLVDPLAQQIDGIVDVIGRVEVGVGALCGMEVAIIDGFLADRSWAEVIE